MTPLTLYIFYAKVLYSLTTSYILVMYMNNVFETKRKPLNRVARKKYDIYREVKKFKKCVLCGKNIDYGFKERVCLSCNDKISVTHIEHNKKYGVL